MSTLNPSDLFLINRNGISYYVTQENLMAQIEDTDLLLVNRGGVSYKIPASEMSFGGPSNPLEPALPPFGGLTTTETVLVSPDGKVVFSTNGTDYSSSVTIPLDTFYYVDWGTNILEAAQDSKYEATVSVSYPSLNINNSVIFEINSIDKLPDPFTFTDTVDNFPDSLITSNIVSPLNSINAPATIWVSSDAPVYELRIGNGPWFDPPAVANVAYVSPLEEIQVRQKTGLGSDTTYSTEVNIGYGDQAGEFVTGVFNSTTQAIAVADPVLSGVTTPLPVQPSFTASAYSEVGGAGTHAYSNWQIATDAEFTNIVTQNLNDTTNKTSWTPYVTNTAGSGQALGRLNGSTQYYVRVQYVSSLGYTSNYDVETSTTEVLTTDFTTSSQNINRPPSLDTFEYFTVPNNIGRIRVTLNGLGTGGNNFSNPVGGGKVGGTFNVAPGEKIRIYNVKEALGLFEDIAMERNDVIVIAGNAGTRGGGKDSEGYNCGDNDRPTARGGVGGGSSGASGVAGNQGTVPGGGASQSGPGSAGANVGESQYRQPAPGDGFAGGLGGRSFRDGDNRGDDTDTSGGTGGGGWYGGGGGGSNWGSSCNPATGGGGSSRFQPVSWRAGTQTQNDSGASVNQTAFVTIEW